VVGSDEWGGEREVPLSAFWIDRSETTNHAYRSCYQAGVCSMPRAPGSATRPDYFLAPLYDTHPVIYVTWNDAATYCAWVGKRLPIEEEWEVAAGSLLMVGGRTAYPWGATFEPRFVNSAERELGDTQSVRFYHPYGDAPSGASDMAGNVAEWTATFVEQGGQRYAVVKGGSFRDNEAGVRVTGRELVVAEDATEWIGFRCARSQ
jgi:formylglycine-generating enzyme required for sulfatase activity